MAATVPRTKLAAVNAMLEDVGDRPVNSLAGSSRRDVTRAISTLDDFSRMVQSRGWWFNTERRRITVDGSGYYNIPDDIVHVEVEAGGPTTGQYDATPLLVIREGRLYDTANATDVFTGEPYIDVIVFKLLEFEKLPTNAREYIYAGARAHAVHQVQALPLHRRTSKFP